DFQNKEWDVTVKKKKFTPINVYKGFVKIALSLCPKEDLKHYQKTIDWLSKNDSQTYAHDIPAFLFRTRLSNKYYSKPSATLYKRKHPISGNIYRANLCLIVYSGVLVFQIFIPFCEETDLLETKKYKYECEIFPAFAMDFDFSSEGKKIILDSN